MSSESAEASLGFSVNPNVIVTNVPPVLAAPAWAKAYNGDHGPAISMTQGVPSTPPSAAFLARLSHETSKPENTTYGAITGESGLRNALARNISTIYSGNVGFQNINITSGCNMAAHVIFQTLARTGDEIILPSPWYFDHELSLDMLGIKLVPLPCKSRPQDGGFVPDLEDAEKLISARTKAIVLISPNNPTGAIYSPALIRTFFDLCASRKIALIVDETYRDFLSPSQMPPHALFSLPNWQNTLISLYSFSKSFSIPGHRVGAMIASPALISQAAKVLDTTMICAPRPAQKTLEWAIHDKEQQKWRNDRRDELLERAKVFKQVINGANATIANERGSEGAEWQGWNIEGLGAYYAFLKHPYVSLGMNQLQIAQLLARHVGVLVLPGTFFGQGVHLNEGGKREQTKGDKEQHLRISIANVFEKEIKKLEARLVAFDKILLSR